MIETIWNEDRHPREAQVKDPSRGSVVYPEGCTLNVSSPTVCLRATGRTCYPFRRPIVAMVTIGEGRMAVIGSSSVFSDEWLEEEGNLMLLHTLVNQIMDDSTDLYMQASGQIEISDYRFLCDTKAMASGPMACLDEQEDEDIPKDLMELARFEIFDAASSLQHELPAIYEKLGVAIDSEIVIRPRFSVLKIDKVFSVHPPSFFPLLRHPEMPLLDLDEMASAPVLRLNRLANKCGSDRLGDVEYFLREAAEICGIPLEADNDSPGGNVLKYIVNCLL